MNKKKEIVILLVLVLVAAGLYVFATTLVPRFRQADVVTHHVSREVKKPEWQKFLALKKLNADISFLLTFSPRQIDPAFAQLTKLKSDFSNTRLWKKNDIDARFNEEINLAIQKSYQGSPSPHPTADDLGKLISQFWSELNEALFTVSSRTFHVTEKGEFPYLRVELSFSSSNIPDKLNQFLLAQVEKAKSTPQQDPFSLRRKKTPDGAVIDRAFDLFFRDKTSEIFVAGVIYTADARLIILLGTDNEDVFLATEQDKLFIERTDFQKLSPLLLPESIGFAYFNTYRFLANYEKLLKLAETQEQPIGLKVSEQVIRRTWGAISAFISSVNLINGANLNQCSLMKTESQLYQIYKEATENRQREKETRKSSFHKLVHGRTLFAFRISGTWVRMGIETVKDLYLSDELFASTHPDEAEQARQLVTQVEAKLKEFDFQELGVVVNASAVASTPEILLYLGDGELETEIVIGQLKDLVNQVAVDVAGIEPIAETLVNSSGKSVLKVPLKDGFIVYAAAVSETSLMIAMNELLIETAKLKLNLGETYLDTLEAKQHDMKARLSDSNYFYLLNTSVALQMLRPFIGIFLSSQSGIPYEQAEIEEVLAHAGAIFFSAEHIYEHEFGTMCTHSEWTLLQTRQN